MVQKEAILAKQWNYDVKELEKTTSVQMNLETKVSISKQDTFLRANENRYHCHLKLVQLRFIH